MALSLWDKDMPSSKCCSPTFNPKQQLHSQSQTTVTLSVPNKSPTLSPKQKSHTQSQTTVPHSVPNNSSKRQSHIQSQTTVSHSIPNDSPTLSPKLQSHPQFHTQSQTNSPTLSHGSWNSFVEDYHNRNRAAGSSFCCCS